MLFQPPFPETGTELFEIAMAYVHFAVLFLLIVLFLYCFKVLKNMPIIVAVYFMSLVIGFEWMSHGNRPISPTFEIFFVILQTTVFIVSAIEMFEARNIRKKRE